MKIDIHLVLLGLLSLTSCANHYSVDTNLDEGRIASYFQPASVKMYRDISQLGRPYQSIAKVEGVSCQSQADLPPAQERDARTQARAKAAKLNANAIIFSRCIDHELPSCLSAKLCFAEAFKETKAQ